jgi:hypothetical protein
MLPQKTIRLSSIWTASPSLLEGIYIQPCSRTVRVASLRVARGLVFCSAFLFTPGMQNIIFLKTYEIINNVFSDKQGECSSNRFFFQYNRGSPLICSYKCCLLFPRTAYSNRLRLKESKDGVQGFPLVMLGKVSGLEREKHRFESRGVLSLQRNVHLLRVLCLLYFY